MIEMASHALAALAFALLAAVLALRHRGHALARWVAGAALLSALWAAGVVWAAWRGPWAAGPAAHLEPLRTAAWLAVLLLVVHRPWGLDRRPRSAFVVAASLGFLVAVDLVLDMAHVAWGPASPAALAQVATRIVLAISGLVLLHNIYTGSLAGKGPGFRFLAVGIGVIFAYDLNLYTLEFLLGQVSPALVHSRGIANALAVPLILLSFRDERTSRFAVSREAAFNTISFAAIGGYLVVMSVLAYGLRLAGGDWGMVLQVSFLTFTLILGALVALSPSFRARLRVWIARNFYRYRYDYRREWLKFIETMSAPADGAGVQPVRERVVEAMALVLNCPGAALFEPDGEGRFVRTVSWNWADLEPQELGEAFAPGSGLVAYLADLRILDFDELRAGGRLSADPEDDRVHACPEWVRADGTIWLGVPLAHRGRLLAVLLLARSPVVADLNWEDYDLLRTLGQQGASYLAEAAAQAALDEARAFDEFNRRFAFVMHDLKNVVSQLDLVARNAERHIDNPEFRKDLLATLAASVTKMRDLLALMGRQAAGAAGRTDLAEAELVDLSRIARDVVAALRRRHSALVLEGDETPLLVRGEAARLEVMLTHLVQNAIDASAPGSPVRVVLGHDDRQARVVVEDRGHGMSAAFVRDELFRPFRSGKAGGFGIGAYEAREIARAHRGRIDVVSRPGEGSRFSVVLPLAEPTRRTRAAA
ncbi:MAG: PEP-CTERM system histidine kinase PrsK [Sphingomonadaceae bacterium]|nr:PEP-CTERM system histidine kinase PrsK [Sphingomonadaceae bacterium]MDW8414585.1 PEP-CTERM system histidine kinase PrsK [Thermaurantiacus sp.]